MPVATPTLSVTTPTLPVASPSFQNPTQPQFFAPGPVAPSQHDHQGLPLNQMLIHQQGVSQQQLLQDVMTPQQLPHVTSPVFAPPTPVPSNTSTNGQ